MEGSWKARGRAWKGVEGSRRLAQADRRRRAGVVPHSAEALDMLLEGVHGAEQRLLRREQAIRGDQRQLEAIRGDQRQSEAIR